VSTWTPSGAWKFRFRTALNEAFDDQDLELLTADYLTPNLFSKVTSTNKRFDARLGELIEWARMNDCLPDLVSAARERRPRNPKLAAIAQELGLTITGGARVDNPTGSPLEEIIQQNAGFMDMSTLVARLAAVEGQVCRLVIPGGGGTGFLVGPNLVLTNQHVIRRIAEHQASPADVRAVFDYRATADGASLARKDPIEVRLDADWHLWSRPPSQFDWDPNRGDAAPGEVDAALIRLAEPVGELPLRGDGGGTDQVRGWVDAVADPPALAAGNQVFLVQHPRTEPLRLSIGTVSAFNGSGTRVRYDANSRDGSSGSPCFDSGLRLAALHHAHDLAQPPAWNQAVPFAWVQQAIADAEITLPPAGG
jgi:hypothetical protein